MIRRTLTSSVLLGLLLSSGTALAASPPVGLTLYAEQWNPARTNGESLVTLTSSPTLVSDTLTASWGSFRNWYLGNIPAQLAGANYIHSVSSAAPDGVTLYSRTGDFHRPPEMTLTSQPQMKIVPNGVSGIAGIFSLPGSSISFCATTPSFAGKYADPCVTFTVDMTVNVGMQIGDTPGHMIQVTNATVSLSNFHYGNENFPAEVAVVVSDILKFLGGPDYQAMLAKTVNSQRQSVLPMLQKPIDTLDGQIEAYEQTALRNINQQLGSAGSFDRLMHLAVWARNSPNSQMLTLLVAPPKGGLAINPASETAQFSGTMTFDDSVSQLPASCATYDHSPQFTAQVQTGPRPVLAFDLSNKPEWGDAPMQPLAVAFNGGALQGRSCSYSLGHLAVGLPNLVNFSNIQTKASGMPSAQAYLLIQPKRWGNPVVLGPNGSVVSVGGAGNASGSPIVAQIRGTATNPQVLDLTASTSVLLQEGVGARSRQTQIGKVSPGDPMLNPQAKAAGVSAATVANPATAVANPVASTPAAASVAPTAAAPSWTAPGAATAMPGSASTIGNSSLGRSTTVQQPAIQQPGMRTAPSSLSR
ncbi:MAG TPA: hypothetical protein VGM84_27560 [Steroidobacteraceae bacterium]|jgi:hypothetical protein